MIRKPTPEQGTADFVLFVDTEDLADPLPMEVSEGEKRIPRASATSKPAAKRRPRKPKPWQPGEPLTLYNGNEGLLVRSVLLRSNQYESVRELPQIMSSYDACELLRHLGYHDQEHIVVLALNNQNRVAAIYEASIGPMSSAPLEVRSVQKILILTGTNTCIIAHNHPGGAATPSDADVHLTKELAKALRCNDFHLMDHIIVSHGHCYSFADDSRFKYIFETF